MVWPGWSIKIIYKNVVNLKNTTCIINRRIFRILFVQDPFSTYNHFYFVDTNFPVFRNFTWKLELVSNILWMIVSRNFFFLLTRLRPLETLISLTIFATLRPFTQFNLKFKQQSCKNVLKFTLRFKCFSNLFTEVEIWYWKSFQIVLGRFSEK